MSCASVNIGDVLLFFQTLKILVSETDWLAARKPNGGEMMRSFVSPMSENLSSPIAFQFTYFINVSFEPHVLLRVAGYNSSWKLWNYRHSGNWELAARSFALHKLYWIQYRIRLKPRRSGNMIIHNSHSPFFFVSIYIGNVGQFQRRLTKRESTLKSLTILKSFRISSLHICDSLASNVTVEPSRRSKKKV